MQGVQAAYYLIHSMAAGHGYHTLDMEAARNFALAASAAGVEHIIYLGGLADPGNPGLALHLKSRIQSGEGLRQAGVPVTEFRAGIIVGPGSVSFEMIRFIAEQLPLMVVPRWLMHRSQPIATPDILAYLVAALETPACRGRVIELGCETARYYINIMREYAQLRGLKRTFLLLPFTPPFFMAFFIDKLTPVPYSYALPLVEGLQNDSLVRDRTLLSLFPAIQPMDYTEAVRRALADTHPGKMERIWLDAGKDSIQMMHEGMFVNYRRVEVAAPPGSAFSKVQSLGGENGWLYWNPVWKLRGWFDRLLGGPGLRGRISVHPADRLPDGQLRVADVIDFYRVEHITDDTLRMHAELKAPGEGWMEWKVTPYAGGTLLEQTAFFMPKGLLGFLYWYLLNPFHRAVFDGLVRALKQEMEK
jgi:uncharacterized protein YbjT (DUF2867 family)